VIWLGWRQQRTETLIAAGLLVFVGAILVPVGIEMAHVYSRDGLSHCLGFSSSRVCGDAVGSFQQRFDRYTSLVGWFNLVPGLFGVALAAPFVLELERGTHRLAWTQSITRRRWVVTKLALAVGSTLVAAAVLLAIYLWWRAPLVRITAAWRPAHSTRRERSCSPTRSSRSVSRSGSVRPGGGRSRR
jgi:hypothetical protein